MANHSPQLTDPDIYRNLDTSNRNPSSFLDPRQAFAKNVLQRDIPGPALPPGHATTDSTQTTQDYSGYVSSLLQQNSNQPTQTDVDTDVSWMIPMSWLDGISILNIHFRENQHPDKSEIDGLAQQILRAPHEVNTWFVSTRDLVNRTSSKTKSSQAASRSKKNADLMTSQPSKEWELHALTASWLDSQSWLNQLSILNTNFKRNEWPDNEAIGVIAQHAFLATHEVEFWFVNTRDLVNSQSSRMNPSRTARRRERKTESMTPSSRKKRKTQQVRDASRSIKVGILLRSRPDTPRQPFSESSAFETPLSRGPFQRIGRGDKACLKSPKDMKELSNHEKTHFPKNAFRCDFCDPPHWVRRLGNAKQHLIAKGYVESIEADNAIAERWHDTSYLYHDRCGSGECEEIFTDRETSLKHIHDHQEKGAKRLEWTHRCATSHKFRKPEKVTDKKVDSEDEDDEDHDHNDTKDKSNKDTERDFDDGSVSIMLAAARAILAAPTYFEPFTRRAGGQAHRHSPISRVLRKLGTGGFAKVHEVEFRGLGSRRFALKTIEIKFKRPAAVDAFKKELAALTLLANSHPHIISFHGTFRLGHNPSLILSPVAEMNLAQLLRSRTSELQSDLPNVIRRDGTIASTTQSLSEHQYLLTAVASPPTAAVKHYDLVNSLLHSMGCLTSAVAHLHSWPSKTESVVHGDIKPQNILVFQTTDGRFHLRIADFGSAKIARNESVTGSASRSFTRKYQPPEHDEKAPQPSRRADIWALGCVFSEMLKWMMGIPLNEIAPSRVSPGRTPPLAPGTGSMEWPLLLSTLERDYNQAQPSFVLPLGIVSRMLSVDPQRRPTAQEVAACLPYKCHRMQKPVSWPKVSLEDTQPDRARLGQSLDLKTPTSSTATLHNTLQRTWLSGSTKCGVCPAFSCNRIDDEEPEKNKSSTISECASNTASHSPFKPRTRMVLPLFIHVNPKRKVEFNAIVDTGSEVNVISRELVTRLGYSLEDAEASSRSVHLADGRELKSSHQIKLICFLGKAPNKSFKTIFELLPEMENRKPIIGLQILMALDILTSGAHLLEKEILEPAAIPECFQLSRPLHTLSIRLNGIEIQAFLDTGSDLNLMSGDFARRQNLRVESSDSINRPKLANGRELSLSGHVSARAGNPPHQTPFFILEQLTADVLIGQKLLLGALIGCGDIWKTSATKKSDGLMNESEHEPNSSEEDKAETEFAETRFGGLVTTLIPCFNSQNGHIAPAATLIPATEPPPPPDVMIDDTHRAYDPACLRLQCNASRWIPLPRNLSKAQFKNVSQLKRISDLEESTQKQYFADILRKFGQ